jgi:hypothetical protein
MSERLVTTRWRAVTPILTGLILIVLGGATRSAAESTSSLPDSALQATTPTTFTLSITPRRGEIGSTFTVAMTMAPGPCGGPDVGFYLDGAVESGRELAPVAPMPDSCTAQATVTVPDSWLAGAKRIYGTYGAIQVPPGEHAAIFIVTEPATPSPSPSGSTSVGKKPSPSPSAVVSQSPNPEAQPLPAVLSGLPASAGSRSPAGSASAAPGVSYTPTRSRSLADLRSTDTGVDMYPFAWLALGLAAIAGLLGAIVVRRRRAAGEADGRHRQAPGRWNASDYQ